MSITQHIPLDVFTDIIGYLNLDDAISLLNASILVLSFPP